MNASKATGADTGALRVLIASSVYPPKIGGPASQAELFARELRRRGAEVRVLTYGPRSEMKNGVKVEYLDCAAGRGALAACRRSLAVARQVKRLFRTFKPDVVQMQTPTGVLPLTVGIFSRLYRTPSWVKFAADPVLQFLHQRAPSQRRGNSLKLRLRAAALKLLAKLVFRTYRFAWATSPVVAKELKERWGVPEERIVTAPNLVELQHISPAIRPGTGQDPGAPFRLLIVTRLQRHKGVDIAIRALAELKDSRVVLRVVGEGDEQYAEELRRLAQQLGISNRVEWPGKIAREHLAEEYRRASLLLVPSRYEPFGIVLIEAMASGLPIAASNVGGIPHVVNGGECALLVEAGDAAALARAITDLAGNPDEMRRLSEAGLIRAREFDAEAGVGKWLDRYRELTQRCGQTQLREQCQRASDAKLYKSRCRPR